MPDQCRRREQSRQASQRMWSSFAVVVEEDGADRNDVVDAVGEVAYYAAADRRRTSIATECPY